MKRLFLLRHAKSSWADPALADHDRPLAGRGERAAETVGRYLARMETRPDEVLCSSARRAVDTLTRLRDELALEPPIRVERHLYDASCSDLLARVREVRDDVSVLLVIGHAPAIAELACALAAPDGSRARRRLEQKFPTGAFAELTFGVAHWREVGPGRAKLIRFLRPKDLQ